jgi:hypothetical protein
MNDLMEMRGCWKMKEEALDHIVWKIFFGRHYGLVV